MLRELAGPMPKLRLSDGYADTSPHLRDEVRTLQRQLIGWGYPLVPDGRYGPSTEAAVRSFQSRRGLVDHGYTDARTWEALLVADKQPIGAGFHPKLSADVSKGQDGSGKNATLSLVDTASGSGVVLEVPWYSQYDSIHVESAGDTACYRACRAMARAVGVVIPPGTSNRIQVATAEDSKGHVTVASARVTEALAYIDGQLVKKRPVAVGVSHKNANYNADGITDHYVLVFGKQTEQQGVVYLYNDPATRHEQTGRAGRFRVDARTGNLVHDGNIATGYVVQRHTEMSMVVRNVE